MASTHKSLRSGTANKRPTTSIADGQIALNTNTTSPGLFFKDSTGATIIKVGPVHVGTTAPNASPAAGGSSGNSTGEVWLDTSLTPNGVKIWNGASWTNATPIGSTTVQGLLELATNAETQTGTDPDRAVTPAGLQSKVSDSTSTTSSTTIASSTAVKSAYDLANAALPKSGGTVTGNLEIGTTGSLSFEGATADAFETTIAVVDPTADRTITLPDTTGTVVTTGDTGTVTSTMIADGTIVDGDISATAEIAVSKLADGTARQLLQTDAAGTGVEWASNIDVPGTLDVTSTATFDSIASHPLGSAAAPTITFTGDTNTGIYSPGADQVAISTGGSGRLFVDASGRVGVGTSSLNRKFHVEPTGATAYDAIQVGAGFYLGNTSDNASAAVFHQGGGATLEIGSQDYIRFTTGGAAGSASERLRITSTGLVGVGTSSVEANVDIVGSRSTSANNTITDAALRTRSTSGGLENFAIRHRGASNGISGLQYVSQLIDSGSNGMEIYTAGSTPVVFGTNATERLRITSAGNVGIGTSSPSASLDVNGTANISGAAVLGSTLNLTSGGITNGYTGTITSGSYEARGATPVFRLRSTGNANNCWIGMQTGNNVAELFWTWETAAKPLTITAGGVERMRIEASGNVGIGTTSPAVKLDVNGDIFASGGDIYTGANRMLSSDSGIRPLIFGLGAVEKARIDSSGRWLLGTSTASNNLRLNQTFAVVNAGGTGTYGGASLTNYGGTASDGACVFDFNRSRGSTDGSMTSVASGDSLGFIQFRGADGTGFIRAAQITCEVDGTPGTNDMPGRLVFSTTADGSSSPTERMRIRNTGQVWINQTANMSGTTDSVILQAKATGGDFVASLDNTNASGGYGLYIRYTGGAPNNTANQFLYCQDTGSVRAEIRSNGGLANYSANNANLSDINAKKDITPAAGTWDCIKEWEIVNYRYKDQPDDADLNLGVIAQQVAESCPEVITVFQEAKEATEDQPAQEERLGVKEQQMYWMAIKALQEAQVRIEALEAEVAALKAQ